jgi:hypothetical protein
VLRSTQTATVDNLQSLCKIWKLAQIYDECVASQEMFRRLYTEVSAPAAKDAGLPSNCVPLPPGDVLAAFIKEANRAIDTTVSFKPTHPNEGWIVEPKDGLAALVSQKNYNNADYLTNQVTDTVVVALSTDKAPFQHNGKSLVMGHLEDLTCLLRSRNKHNAVRSFKDPMEAVLAACFEATDESYQTLVDNYCEYREAMRLHEQGLALKTSHLKPLQDSLIEAVSNLDYAGPSTSAAALEEMEDLVRTRSALVQAWFEQAARDGHVLHVAGSGYFFVQWHVIMDMACLRSALKVEGEGSMVRPCSNCDKPYKEFELLGPPGAPRCMLDAAFPIPRERYHACAMHCKHRVTERFLYNLMKWMDQAAALAPADKKVEMARRRTNMMRILNASRSTVLTAEWGEELVVQDRMGGQDEPIDLDGGQDDDGDGMVPPGDEGGVEGFAGFTLEELIAQVEEAADEPQKFKHTFRGMNVNGGRCRWVYDHTSKLLMVSMNGDEVQRFLVQASKMFEYVMGDVAAAGFQRWDAALLSWNQQLEYMVQTSQTAAEKEIAVSHAKQFVRTYHAAAGPSSITYYLHCLHDHPEWFYCHNSTDPQFVYSVSWWSAQAMEAGHRIRKRVLRSHTRHGMEINVTKLVDSVETIAVCRHAPNIYELFRWQFRILMYRQLQRDEAEELAVKVVTCADLNYLTQASDSKTRVFQEAEILEDFQCSPEHTKLRVVGPGKIVGKLHVVCSFATHYARAAFGEQGGTLEVTSSGMYKGRLPMSQMDDIAKEKIRNQKAARYAAREQAAIQQAGYGSYREVVRKAVGKACDAEVA